jgi:hypothetical protein
MRLVIIQRLIFIFALLASQKIFAQVSVRVLKQAKLFAQPSENSQSLSETGGRSNFRALEQSADKKWVFISDGLRFGWIRKIFVKVVSDSEAAMNVAESPSALAEEVRVPVAPKKIPSSNSDDEDLAESDEDVPLEDDADPSSVTKKKAGMDDDDLDEMSSDDSADDDGVATYLVSKPGVFFEDPKKTAPRFGVLEINDKVEVLDESSDKKWVKARLVETGEEGWLPKTRIGRKVNKLELDELEKAVTSSNHLVLYGVYSPLPWSFGTAVTLRHTFSNWLMAETPIQLGLSLGYDMGSIESFLGQDISATYLDGRFLMHWAPALSNSTKLPIELGILYKYGVISTNLTAAEVEASNTRLMDGEFGVYLGIGMSFELGSAFAIEIIPTLQMTSSVDFTARAGLALMF